jgi:membrane protein implicated in regulation of membrane protease activity
MRLLLFTLLAASVPALALLAYVLHSSRQKKKHSRLPLNLVGRVGSVERALDPVGFVLVEGELWRARVRGVDSIGRVGSNVRVVGASGCFLEVEPVDRARPSS